MEGKKKDKKLKISLSDFMLANRKAARQEEIDQHGKPVSFRSSVHKSKKVYNRKADKKAGVDPDQGPFR